MLSFVVILCGLAAAKGKRSLGSFAQPTYEPMIKYLTQFGCAIGQCHYSAKFRIGNAEQLLRAVGLAVNADQNTFWNLRVYLDEEWESKKFINAPKCDRKEHARIDSTSRLPLNGDWSVPIDGYIKQVVRPHVWYFALEDCGDSVRNTLVTLSGRNWEEVKLAIARTPIQVQWDLSLLQVDGSHLSYEYHRTHLYNFIGLIAFAGLFAVLVTRQIRSIYNNHAAGIHPMIRGLNLAVLLQIVYIILHTLHVFRYSKNGIGLPGIDLLADLFSVGSQSVMSFLLLFVAMGFALNTPRWASTKIVLPLFVAVYICQMITVVVDRYAFDTRFKFHSLEGVGGWIICASRLFLWSAFFLSLQTTIAQQGCSPAIEMFLSVQFQMAGSLYLLALPIIYVITCAFAPYLRHHFSLIGNFTVQLLSILWLSNLFILRGSKSEFFRVSELSRSILPGFGAVGSRRHID